MALSTNDVQTTGFKHRIMALLPFRFNTLNRCRVRVIESINLRFPVTTKHNVGTTTGHVGCNGYRSRTTGISDDLSLTLIFFRVKNVVLNLSFLEYTRDVF